MTKPEARQSETMFETDYKLSSSSLLLNCLETSSTRVRYLPLSSSAVASTLLYPSFSWYDSKEDGVKK